MLSTLQLQLLERAKDITRRSYSPYSKIQVGAAVLAGERIYEGANIENSSYSLSLCAERVAIALARLDTDQEITGIAIHCNFSSENSKIPIELNASPCGACRQWFIEFAPNAWVVTNTWDRAYTVKELIPNPFHIL